MSRHTDEPTGGTSEGRLVNVRLKRVYDEQSPSDGYRVLVDRLWPRGVSKEKLRLDEWCKEVAPSTELRQWFGHDPDKFTEFEERYRAELESDDASQAVEHLRKVAAKGALTLLFAAKNADHNHAVVLRNVLGD